MKKLFLFCLFSFAMSAQTVAVKLKVHIDNPNSDSLSISNETNTFRKVLRSKNGNFNFDLKLKPGIYYIEDGIEYGKIYFEKGSNLSMAIDAKQFDETIKFTGKGERENNFLALKMRDDEKFNMAQGRFQGKSDYVGYEKARDDFKLKSAAKLAAANFNAVFVAYVNSLDKYWYDNLDAIYEPMKNATNVKGKFSSSFAFENHKGGTSTLEDFKGKYVYIDIWATWCGPCRQQIPFLKALEEKYHDKNIVFVSISIDATKDYEAWKEFVTKNNLGGVQLYENANETSEFIKGYGIVAIPRFILIDPNGLILESNAARPSSPELQKQLDDLIK